MYIGCPFGCRKSFDSFEKLVVITDLAGNNTESMNKQITSNQEQCREETTETTVEAKANK